MLCRAGCGACCIEPSISSAIPLHPLGKPAAVRCLHLDAANYCLLFLEASRPAVCNNFQATIDSCGNTQMEAMSILAEWERLTAPDIH